MNIILPGPRPNQVKELTKVKRIVSTNLNRSRNKNHNGIWIVARLNIGCFDLVLDLTYAAEFGDDGFGALDLLSFEGEHRGGTLCDGGERTGRLLVLVWL